MHLPVISHTLQFALHGKHWYPSEVYPSGHEEIHGIEPAVLIGFTT